MVKGLTAAEYEQMGGNDPVVQDALNHLAVLKSSETLRRRAEMAVLGLLVVTQKESGRDAAWNAQAESLCQAELNKIDESNDDTAHNEAAKWVNKDAKMFFATLMQNAFYAKIMTGVDELKESNMRRRGQEGHDSWTWKETLPAMIREEENEAEEEEEEGAPAKRRRLEHARGYLADETGDHTEKLHPALLMMRATQNAGGPSTKAANKMLELLEATGAAQPDTDPHHQKLLENEVFDEIDLVEDRQKDTDFNFGVKNGKTVSKRLAFLSSQKRKPANKDA